MSEKQIELGSVVYKVRLGDGGVEIAKLGEEYPYQYLSYRDLRDLVKLKNKHFAECNGNLAQGEKAWRLDVAKRLTGKTA